MPTKSVTIGRGQLERICRTYKSNTDAARALGVTDTTIGRWCAFHGVESPSQRTAKARAGKKKGYHDGKGDRYGS